MRLAFLVLAHHKPQQFGRLIRVLQEMGTCFAHIDAHTPIEPFLAAAPAGPSMIYLEDRCPVRWASFDVVRATLKLMQCAQSCQEFDYLVLLSGVDYPIKSNAQIQQVFESGGEHIRSIDMPHPGHPLARLDSFYVASRHRRSALLHILNCTLRFLPKRRWKNGALSGMTPASGSQWWGLSRDCVAYVLQFVEEHPEYSAFLRRSQLPDEMFFQIIVRNSPFAARMRWTPTFDIWTRPTPPYPATLGCEDVELLRAQSHLFARKFDIDLDPSVFDRIDRELRYEERE